jgi:hypothetical protein
MSLYLIINHSKVLCNQLNPRRPCDLSKHTLRNAICQPPGSQKPPRSLTKVHHPLINTPKVLDIHCQASYNNSITLRSKLMSLAYHQAQKQRYRVTLELEVLGDFDPHNLDWEKVFHLEPAEKVLAYVEDLSTPDRW